MTLFPPLTRTGLFDVSSSRHFIAPLESLKSDAVREVNILAPARSGKTLIGDVWLCWTVMNDPGPFRLVMQDDQIAKEQAESRTMLEIKALPGIAEMMPSNRHKEREQEIIFPSGMNLYIGGPALGKLQSKGFRYVWVDEPWLPTIIKQFSEIKGRLGDYLKMQISKLLCTAQGGEDGDQWDFQFHSGQVEEWTVECEKCGHFQIPEFMGRRPDGTLWGIRWDSVKDARGLWDINKALPTVRYECERCAHPHLDTMRVKDNWNRTGKYLLTTEPNATKKSFHWSCVIDSLWREDVDQWLQARNAWHLARDINPTVTFWKKRCAKFKSPRSAQEDFSYLQRQAYEIESDWKDEWGRAMIIDRQSEDVFWWTVRSLSKSAETRRLGFGKCFSFLECEEVRKKFKVHAVRVLIDSGYKPKGDNGVYAACIKYGWLACKGVGGVYSFTHDEKRGSRVVRIQRSYAKMTRGDSETAAGDCKLVRFSSDAMNDRIKGLMDADKWIEPMADDHDPLEVEYRKQMSAEGQSIRRNARTGKTETYWEEFDKNNHARDLAKMFCLFATLAHILRDEFEPTPTPQEKEIDK